MRDAFGVFCQSTHYRGTSLRSAPRLAFNSSKRPSGPVWMDQNPMFKSIVCFARRIRDSRKSCWDAAFSRRQPMCVLFGVCLAGILFTCPTFSLSTPDRNDASSTNLPNRSDLEELRRTGDLGSQRQHLWRVMARMTGRAEDRFEPAFETWYGEDEVFGYSAQRRMRGIRGFSRG